MTRHFRASGLNARLLLLAAATTAALGLFACDRDARAGPPVSFVRYQVANGGEGVVASARRDDVIVLQAFWRRRLIARIRAANPDCKILIYQNLSRTAVPQLLGRHNTAITRGEAEAHGWASGVPDPQESWLHFVEPNDAAGYASLALRRMATKLKRAARAGQPVDGVFLDDVNSFSPSAVGGNPTSSEAEWNGWMTQVNGIVGPGLQKLGYKVMANLSGSIAARNLESGGWEERQFRYFTYVFDEHFAYWADGTPQLQLFVDEAFRLASVARRVGTVYVASVPDGGDEAKATFGLALLLIQSPGRVAKAPGRGDGEPWYPVYERARSLGRPLRPRVSPSPGVWTRKFEGGSVRVNLLNRTATIR
jgi:hypothetical protein